MTRQGWELPLEHEVEGAYERLERQRPLMLLVTVAVISLAAIAGGAPGVLAFAVVPLVLHFALRGRYERMRAAHVAQGPAFSRAELIKARSRVRRLLFGSIAVAWLPVLIVGVRAPEAIPALALVSCLFSAVFLVFLRVATKRYERLLAKDRPA
jgi:hypothetical protein